MIHNIIESSRAHYVWQNGGGALPDVSIAIFQAMDDRSCEGTHVGGRRRWLALESFGKPTKYGRPKSRIGSFKSSP